MMFDFFEQKTERLPNGKIHIEKSSLERKKRTKKIPLKEVNVVKGDVEWFDAKNEKLLKELAVDYFNAMKESFAGTVGLTNKWVIWSQRPIGSYRQFAFPRSKRRKRVRQFLSMMWQKYQNTMRSTIYFDEYEKLRALDFQLNKVIQMGDMGFFFLQKMNQCR